MNEYNSGNLKLLLQSFGSYIIIYNYHVHVIYTLRIKKKGIAMHALAIKFLVLHIL